MYNHIVNYDLTVAKAGMKRELEHFYIGYSYGGNQDWFRTFMMRIGGCGAETVGDRLRKQRWIDFIQK